MKFFFILDTSTLVLYLQAASEYTQGYNPG
jgi:hypothetical protein